VDPRRLHIRHPLRLNHFLVSVVCEEVPVSLHGRQGQQNYLRFFVNLPSVCRLPDMKVYDKGLGGCESHGCVDDSCSATRGVGHLALFRVISSLYLHFTFLFP